MKVLCILLIAVLFSQSDTMLASERNWNKREFMPTGLTFLPLVGNPQESRMAVRKLVKGPDLHVEIGNTIDLLRWTYVAENLGESRRSLSLGVSFFSYGYITSVDKSRLKVDAIDGFFGGHVVYSTILYNHPWQLRLRLMHQSAHMVDGRYDKYNESWVGDRLPISYTRDQAEITTLHRFGNIRLGGGARVLFGYDVRKKFPHIIFFYLPTNYFTRRPKNLPIGTEDIFSVVRITILSPFHTPLKRALNSEHGKGGVFA